MKVWGIAKYKRRDAAECKRAPQLILRQAKPGTTLSKNTRSAPQTSLPTSKVLGTENCPEKAPSDLIVPENRAVAILVEDEETSSNASEASDEETVPRYADLIFKSVVSPRRLLGTPARLGFGNATGSRQTLQKNDKLDVAEIPGSKLLWTDSMSYVSNITPPTREINISVLPTLNPAESGYSQALKSVPLSPKSTPTIQHSYSEMNESSTVLATKRWERCVNCAMDELGKLRELPLHSSKNVHNMPFTIWYAAQTRLLETANEAIVQTVQFTYGKDLTLDSSLNAWIMLLSVSDSRGSFYSRKMRLIAEVARKETHVAWELALLHVLSLVDDLASDQEWSHQPERDALYCGIYLEAVDELIQIGHSQNSSENFNAFISRSLVEVWYLNLAGASETTHEQYFKLILRLRPHPKFKAAFSPGGLRIIFSRAFQLISQAASQSTHTSHGDSLVSKNSAYSDNLVEQLFMCHQATDTTALLPNYIEIISPMFLRCLSQDETSCHKTLLSTIFARSLWIAEGYGLLEPFFTALASWIAHLEMTENDAIDCKVDLLRAYLLHFLEEWELAYQCAARVQKQWPTSEVAPVSIEAMLHGIEVRVRLPYSELKQIMVSLLEI